MALTLTPGSESRLDGAPDLPLPFYTDFVDSLARELVARDAEGALYGGDPNNARADAEKWAKDYIEGPRQQTAANRSAAEARAQKNADDRGRQRSAARGVAPESLPMDEYGSVSGRTVQEANRPPEDAEAALMQDQNVADEIVRGYREGDRNWQAEGDRQYSQEYGLGGFDRGPGRSDLDYRRRIQEQQGFIRTPQGMVPIGPQITPERIESVRSFDEWANENPGTERQARYAPEAYDRWWESAAQRRREQNRRDEAQYGTGSDAELMDAMERGNDMAGKQLEQRQLRRAAEDRQAEAEREIRIARMARRAGVSREQARAMMDKERDAIRGGENRPLTFAERSRETQALRDRAGSLRDADLADRRANLRSQRMLLAPGGRGMVNAINELPDEWRHVAILDRITGGRVPQVTPLGVEAVGAQNAMRAFTADVLAGNQPGVREQREIAAANAEAGLPIPVRADRERDKNNGVLPANSPAGQAVLQDIATTTIGSSYATQDEVDRAVERAVAEGIPEADAIAFFNRHAQFANSGFWGTILGAGNFGAPPAAPPAAPPMPIPGGVGPAESLPPAGR